MNNIFEECRQQVEGGAKFRIDLKKRALTIVNPRTNKKSVIKLEDHRDKLGIDYCSMTKDECKNDLIGKYNRYKHSIPSERSVKNARRAYFWALPEKDLDNEDMLYGQPRELAQFILEYSVLAACIQGVFREWGEFGGGTWFWQIADGFVICKSWVD